MAGWFDERAIFGAYFGAYFAAADVGVLAATFRLSLLLHACGSMLASTDLLGSQPCSGQWLNLVPPMLQHALRLSRPDHAVIEWRSIVFSPGYAAPQPPNSQQVI